MKNLPLGIALIALVLPTSSFGTDFPVPGSNPRWVISNGLDMIWVANGGSSSVTKIRASDVSVQGTFAVGAAPYGMAYDGANVWVANASAGSVTKLRESDGASLGTFTVGSTPIGIAFDGANVWVGNEGSGTVTKLRASDGANLGSFTVGAQPEGVLFDGTSIWVAVRGLAAIKQIRPSDGAILNTVSVASGPQFMAYDGTHIWVACVFADSITKVRVSDGSLQGTFAVAHPLGVAFDGTNVWVANQLTNTVTKLRASDGVNLGTYAVGPGPIGVTVDPSGNVWVANEGTNSISKLSASTDLDKSLDGDGIVDLVVGSTAAAEALDIVPDGKIVVGGLANVSGTADFLVARLQANGMPDTSFDGDGIATAAMGPGDDRATAVIAQADGRILVGGRVDFPGNFEFGLARFLPSGALDPSFGSGGKVVSTLSPGYDALEALALQEDGKIVAVGGITNGGALQIGVARYEQSGALDPSFGAGGAVAPIVEAGGYGLAAALQPDGRILAAGYAVTGGTTAFRIQRFDANGALDPTFDGDGIVTTAIGTDAEVHALAVQSNGRILAAGFGTVSGTKQFAVARYHANGAPDLAFGASGIAYVSFGSGIDARAAAIRIQADGKIVVSGFAIGSSATRDFATVRLTSSLGGLDATFGSGGKLVTPLSTADNDDVRALAIQSDGRIVAAGAVRVGTADHVGIVRYVGGSASTCGNGVREPQEQCDDGNLASSDCCSSTCTLETTICRNSAGECDLHEACTGFSATCPADQYAAAGTPCSDDGSICSDDVCNGSSVGCEHTAANAGAVCRPSAGECDVAEACDGVSSLCPADGFAGATTICRSSAGDCDVAEACSGSGPACPTDEVAADGAACPDDGNPCSSDRCDGASATCQHPAGNPGSVCRGVTDVCDVAETCDGASTTCPPNGFASSATQCRASEGECDVAESCSGTTAACPANGFKTVDTACTPDGEICTADVCDSAGACTHPAGNAGTVCRAAAALCDVAETCDGTSSACPADGGQPDSDGDLVCDAQDVCTNLAGGRNFIAARKPKLVVGKINADATPGNDKLLLGAEFRLPTGTPFSALDPIANGLRFVLRRSDGGAVLDVALPGGTYGGAGTAGWKGIGNPVKQWLYLDKSPQPSSSIYRAQVQDFGKKGPSQVKVQIKGKDGTHQVLAADVPLAAIVVIGGQSEGEAGYCGESTFVAPDCSFNGAQNQVTCKR